MSTHLYSRDVSEGIRRKLKMFAIIVVVAFVFLWVRIWYLQILKGEDFKGLSENNRVRLVSLPGIRGLITDRNGETLVSIRPSFNLYITPEDAKDLDVTLDILEEKIDFDEEKLRKNMKKAQPFANVLIKADVNREMVAFVEENNRILPGVHLIVEPLRNYVYRDLAAHVLGYLGEISKEKLEEMKESDYHMGDLMGKEGMEFLYENELKGTKGYKQIEVDVAGRELQILRKLPPESGNQLVLTLDLRLQKVLEQLMIGTEEEPKNGAVVVLKVSTGEILAMASKPSFDPNLFAAGISIKNWRKLIFDKRHPLQNKSIDGQYPPGSTYKIVTALAGLEEKIITPDTSIYCPGHFKLGRGRYRCWKRGGHGSVDLHKALVQSCDVYFYTVGHRLGIDNLAKYAKSLGLGDFTGVNLIGEKTGLVPSTEWKLNAKKEPWLLGETISASIGQGYNLVTPIQQANMLATVINGGLLFKPFLVKGIKDKHGAMIKEVYPKVQTQLKVQSENLELIKEALLGVVNEKRGTGWRARLKDIKVAGKTGTAQVVRLRAVGSNNEEEIPYEFRDHAWFVAFAPYENPQIAVAVIVEHGGHGGAAAAPIARKIIETYFKFYPLESSNIPPENKNALAFPNRATVPVDNG